MKFAFVLALSLMVVSARAQSGGNAEVFTSTNVHSQLAQLADQAKSKGSSATTLADYGSHALKLSERTVNGGAEIHAHFDDVMLVIDGKATLITGGQPSIRTPRAMAKPSVQESATENRKQ